MRMRLPSRRDSVRHASSARCPVARSRSILRPTSATSPPSSPAAAASSPRVGSDLVAFHALRRRVGSRRNVPARPRRRGHARRGTAAGGDHESDDAEPEHAPPVERAASLRPPSRSTTRARWGRPRSPGPLRSGRTGGSPAGRGRARGSRPSDGIGRGIPAREPHGEADEPERRDVEDVPVVELQVTVRRARECTLQ